VDVSRARMMKEGKEGSGPVIYWMSRDQRCADNPALHLAHQRAVELRRPLVVVFALSSLFLGATLRQYGFMLRGLEETVKGLEDARIGFRLLLGGPGELPSFLASEDPAMLVEDFDPLNIKAGWKRMVQRNIKCPAWEVDAHNVIPSWLSSPKQEWAARTFRPKVHQALPRFLHDVPDVEEHPFPWSEASSVVDPSYLLRRLGIDLSVPETEVAPGAKAAERKQRAFVAHRLDLYREDRNDPNLNGQSGLSPYLHYGQLAPLRVALAVQASETSDEAKATFLEELIVRRELADNYCHYCRDHDRYEGLPEWSRRTLEKHARDKRAVIYSLEELEASETDDGLWNTMQREMVRRGGMHGYLRMYWAKRVLEWSKSPREAIERLVRLNDRYQLDGRDPNGYVGILWCVGGLHDRPWKERPIYGTVRYMSTLGMARKFDVDAYERRNLTTE
jgi:deoxyribodipyrimidine photo-lyase